MKKNKKLRKQENMFDKNGSSTLEIFNIGKKYKNRPVLRNVSLLSLIHI